MAHGALFSNGAEFVTEMSSVSDFYSSVVIAPAPEASCLYHKYVHIQLVRYGHICQGNFH